jgi:hypothetical protein
MIINYVVIDNEEGVLKECETIEEAEKTAKENMNELLREGVDLDYKLYIAKVTHRSELTEIANKDDFTGTEEEWEEKGYSHDIIVDLKLVKEEE